jgi:transposase
MSIVATATPAASDAAPPLAPRCRRPPLPPHCPAWTDLDQQLPPEHLARRIAQAVTQLDLQPLHDVYGRTGSPPYRPDLLLAVLLYELQRGRCRPADRARDAHECVPVRWLAQGCTPSRARWYAFRDRLAPWLDDWNRQGLRQAQGQGLTPATRAAVDGSTVAALASRHRLVNDGVLTQRLEHLDQAVARDTTPVADADPSPPAGGVEGPQAPAAPACTPRPGWMAPTPAGRRRQQRRYRHARERLAEWQRRNQRRRREDRKPPEKVLVSLGDPEAVLGLDKLKVYRPLYNVQIATDLDSPLVLAYAVFDQPNDNGLLPPLLDRLTFFWGPRRGGTPDG